MKYLVLKAIGIAGQYYPGASSTTISSGANSATQALASLNGIVSGVSLYFAASGTSTEVQAINRSARAVTLGQSVSTNPNDTVYVNPTILDLDESSYGDTLQGHVAEGYYLRIGGTSSGTPSSGASSTSASTSGSSGTASSSATGAASPPPASGSSTTSSAPAGSTTVTVQVPPNDEVEVEPIGS
jgi:cellulose 1,4-beta-cellobiosidase